MPSGIDWNKAPDGPGTDSLNNVIAALVERVLTGTATLNFGNMAPGVFGTDTITVAGAAVGDAVFLGVPADANLSNGISVWGWVSAANTVTVMVINNNTDNSYDLASGTFRAVVFHY